MISLGIFVCLACVALYIERVEDEEVLLVCTGAGSGADKSYFVINQNESSAEFMNPSEHVVQGKLRATKNAFVLHFPKTKTRYETLVTVNRYSGKMEWEHGEPPFGELFSQNVFRLGVCTQGKNIKRF